MMPDSLIAGNLAQRALNIFKRYGDVYQTAGAWRTLGECYWHINDNSSALICLEHSLKDCKKVEMAQTSSRRCTKTYVSFIRLSTINATAT